MAIATALSLPGSTREGPYGPKSGHTDYPISTPTQTRQEHGPRAEVHTLRNGLQVVLLEDHSAPVVALQTWVRFGSADEDLDVAGIAHVFEHMLFKGTTRFPHGEIAALI